MTMSAGETLEQLAERVAFDLESAGLTPAWDPRTDGAAGGFAVYIDEQQVHVDWFTHHRLDQAELDSLFQTDKLFTDVRRRYDTAQEAMDIALGSILTAFGYRAQPPSFGFGYTVTPGEAPV